MILDQIFHPCHPEHILIKSDSSIVFSCDSCKEEGIGRNYACSLCNFHLHDCCATTEPLTHPFYQGCHFHFQSSPSSDSFCDACGKDILGCVYNCETSNLDLHPSCAQLPPQISFGEYTLKLRERMKRSCHHCGEIGDADSGWSYECKKFSFHIKCVKDLLLQSRESLYLANAADLTRMIPVQDHNKRRKLKKYCKIAAAVIRIIIAAILGDPTAIIAGVVAGFAS